MIVLIKHILKKSINTTYLFLKKIYKKYYILKLSLKASLREKKFIKILCKIEGIEYKETKEVLKRQIRITDIKLVAKELLGIDLKIDI